MRDAYGFIDNRRCDNCKQRFLPDSVTVITETKPNAASLPVYLAFWHFCDSECQREYKSL